MSNIDRLFALIAAANPSAARLQPSSFDVSLPTPATTAGSNTSVSLTARAGSGYAGSSTVGYNRHDLSEFGSGLEFVLDSGFTLDTLLFKLTAILQTTLTADDLLTPDLSAALPGTITQVTLTAHPLSYIWRGALSFQAMVTNAAQTESEAALQVAASIQTQLDSLNASLSSGSDNTGIIQIRRTNAGADDLFFGQAVYLTSAGTMALTSNNDPDQAVAVGFVCQDAIASGGAAGMIQTTGVLAGTVAQWERALRMVGGLVPNVNYYLDTIKGQITLSAPRDPGLYLTYVGRALSTTELSIKIERPITL